MKMAEPIVNANEVSRISVGTLVKGEITSPNDIRIDGHLEGKVVSKGRVVVGDKAVIEGDVVCDNVDFSGKINGSLIVKDTLSLKKDCRVNGGLHIKKLIVELGAHFDGTCKMLTEGEFEKLTGQGDPDAVAPKTVAAAQPASKAAASK